MAEKTEAVDHVKDAERLLGLADGSATASDAQVYAAKAQARASLAIAEQLERLNEKLDGGQLSAFLDNLQGGIQEIVWQNTRRQS